MELIKAENLTKKYSGNTVFENINFTVEKGDFFCILGENGSGKTTLIRILLGLCEPTSGKLGYSAKIKNKIGYLPQHSEIKADFPASVNEVAVSGFLNSARILPFFSKSQKVKAAEILEKLHMLEFAEKPFKELSGGQKQRVLLARALLASSGILLLDEPLTGLDPLATADFFEIIEELKAQGYTIIMISHDIHCAIKYANKILHLSGAKTFFGSNLEYAVSPLGRKMLEEGHHHD